MPNAWRRRNHEMDAVGYSTRDPSRPDQHLRLRTERTLASTPPF